MGSLQGPVLPGDDDHLDPSVSLPQGSPEAMVNGSPGAQCRGSLVSRIDVDEDSPVRPHCDRQLEPEVVTNLPHRPPIHPQGQMPSFDPKRLEGPDLFRFGPGATASRCAPARSRARAGAGGEFPQKPPGGGGSPRCPRPR